MSVLRKGSCRAAGASWGQRVVSWDDPVIKHDPSFALKDSWISDHVTLADLFAHRTGLSDHHQKGTRQRRKSATAGTGEPSCFRHPPASRPASPHVAEWGTLVSLAGEFGLSLNTAGSRTYRRLSRQ